MSSKNKYLISSIIFFTLFIVFTIIIKYVDVKSIGPLNSEVGLSSINGWARDLFSYNDLFYKISKYLGYIPFLIILIYGIVGLKELIEKKSLFKVNKRILLLGVFYIVVAIVYFFFEKVIINYRPVLENGLLEASYPSSHTILSICVCLSSIWVSKYVFKNKDFIKIFNILTILLMIGIVVFRVLSGVHWITDIVGGILISLALCYLYSYSTKILAK